MKKAVSLVLCVFMLTGLLSGCNKTEAGGETQGQTAGSTEGSSQESTGEAEQGDVKYKDDIIVGISGKIVSLDPQTNSNTQHNLYFRMVFDTLLDFSNENNEILPCLAASWETEDAQTYIFKLREDVKFHNGEPLKASDVVFSFERAPGTDSASTLGNLIEEVKATDEYTVELKLKAKNVDFPYLLTLPTASIMSEKAVAEDSIEGTGVGSGPWMVDSYEFGDYFKMKRNDDFWGEPAKAKTVTLRYMPENSPRLIALQTGEIDVCQDPDTLELSYIEDTAGLELQSYTGSAITYVAMNYQKEPFNNQDFRLALCYGVDVEEIIDVVRSGYAERCLSLWGWNQFGYNGGTTAYEYNPELAKEYLAKAYPNGGAKFKISVSSGDRKAIAELIQAQLKQIGIEVEIVEFDTAGLSNATTLGEHDTAVYGCGMNVFGDDMRRLIMPGTGVNKSHYDNARVNELMDLAVTEIDEAKRIEYYKEVQQITFEDGAYLPLYYATGFFGVKEGVGGIDYYPTSHHDMSYIFMVEK